MNLVKDDGQFNLEELKKRLESNFVGILNGMPARFPNPETGYAYRFLGEYEDVMTRRWAKFWTEIETEYLADLEQYKIETWDRIDYD